MLVEIRSLCELFGYFNIISMEYLESLYVR